MQLERTANYRSHWLQSLEENGGRTSLLPPGSKSESYFPLIRSTVFRMDNDRSSRQERLIKISRFDNSRHSSHFSSLSGWSLLTTYTTLWPAAATLSDCPSKTLVKFSDCSFSIRKLKVPSFVCVYKVNFLESSYALPDWNLFRRWSQAGYMKRNTINSHITY